VHAAYSTQAVTVEVLETEERSETGWWKPSMTGRHWGGSEHDRMSPDVIIDNNIIITKKDNTGHPDT